MNNFTVHQGQIIEYQIRKSGYPLTDLARQLGVNRRTLYNWFGQSILKADLVTSIGKVIRHDFSNELPGIVGSKKAASVHTVQKTAERSVQQNWKDKYIELLEKYNEMLLNLSEMRATEN